MKERIGFYTWAANLDALVWNLFAFENFARGYTTYPIRSSCSDS